MGDTSDLKKDTFIKWNDAICVVTESTHVNPGKGSAFVRARLKNVQTGKTIEHTWKVGESVDVVDLDRRTVQYTYKDANNYNFMDNESFEELSISADTLGDKGIYLKDGQVISVLSYEGIPLSVDLPKKLTFKVTESMPAVKGDTAGGRVTKEVTLETGMKLAVPMFIEQGESVIVNTDSGEYVERA